MIRHDLPLWLSILNSKLFKEIKRTWCQRKWLTGQTDSNTFYFEFLDLFVDSTLAKGGDSLQHNSIFPQTVILLCPIHVKQVPFLQLRFIKAEKTSLGSFFRLLRTREALDPLVDIRDETRPLQEVGRQMCKAL